MERAHGLRKYYQTNAEQKDEINQCRDLDGSQYWSYRFLLSSTGKRHFRGLSEGHR